jgi:hypothetical protein
MTDLDHANKWLTPAENLAILAGIIFLALKIQQNTRAALRRFHSRISTDLCSLLLLAREHGDEVLQRMMSFPETTNSPRVEQQTNDSIL